MKQARAALKILHEQDIDGLSASFAGSASVGSSSMGAEFSVTSSPTRQHRVHEKASLTSQHLNPRVKVMQDERTEEARVTKVDESKGIYRELIVVYGNRIEELGLLLVEDSTTFVKAHSMVKHMVRKYFEPTFEIIEKQLRALSDDQRCDEEDRERKHAALQKQKEDTEFLCTNYFLADAQGKRVLDIEANRQRFVWSECVRNDYYLTVLPANGTYIDVNPREELDFELLDDDTLGGTVGGEEVGEDEDHMSDDGGGYGLLPLPSVMSDDMVPSITSTNDR